MATESIISMRGFAKITLALLLLSVCLCTEAWAGANPSVVATGPLSAVATHPAFEVVWNTAISPWGDLFVMDFSANALYFRPAAGRRSRLFPREAFSVATAAGQSMASRSIQ